MNANMAEPIQIDLSAFYGGSIVPRWQDLLRILAIVALSFATIGCSLRQDRDAPAPVAWAERTPLSAIETAFAASNAASTDTAVVTEPKAQGSCNDLEFAFFMRSVQKSIRSELGLNSIALRPSSLGGPMQSRPQ
jgi:hypothetical protein